VVIPLNPVNQMNDEESQPNAPDPRISALRVRIKRMANFDERQEALNDLIGLGHAAQALLPDIVRKVGDWIHSPDFPKLILNLKSEKLLKAAQDAGLRFHPDIQAQLLAAGFAEFEQPLVDYLWSLKDSNSFGLYQDVFSALGDCARLPETLDLLVVLESEFAQRLARNLAKHAEEQRRINLGEMELNDVALSWIDEKLASDFYSYLKKATARLRDRELIGEAQTDIDTERVEEISPKVALADLIDEGESTTLEFKSTLRWDLKMHKVNKNLEEGVMKTIAAFANSKGGTLLIGVANNGQVLGLESDYLTLEAGNRDKFELHLRNLLNERFCKVLVMSNVIIKFHRDGDKEVCRVEATPAKAPVILRVQDKNGVKLEKFCVRAGPMSVCLSVSETATYIIDRFQS